MGQPNAFATMNKWYSANLYPDVKLPTGVDIIRPTWRSGGWRTPS